MKNTPSPTLKQWKELYADQQTLILSPERHQQTLIKLAEALKTNGVIDADELSDLLEQADAAYQWGVEEQLSHEQHDRE